MVVSSLKLKENVPFNMITFVNDHYKTPSAQILEAVGKIYEREQA